MKKEVFLLYSGNAWLEYSSLKLLAVCSSKEKAIIFAKKDARKNKDRLSDYDLMMLQDYKQTQGRDNNYLIAPVNMDELDN